MKKILILTIVLLSSSAFSKTAFVEKTKVSGPKVDGFSAVNMLVKDAIVNNSNISVTESKDMADFIFRPQLLSLGQSYIFSVQKYSKNGTLMGSSKLKSKNSSDLDSVISRVTRSALNGAKASSNVRVGEVVDADSDRSNKKISVTRSFMFGFGPSWSQNVNGNQGVDLMLAYAFGMSPDFDLSVDFSYAAVSGTPAYMSSFTLGGQYYLSRNQHAPFVGANLGYGWARFGGKGNNLFTDPRLNGWLAGINFGMKFFRASSVSFGLMGKARYLFDKFEDQALVADSSNASTLSLNLFLAY